MLWQISVLMLVINSSKTLKALADHGELGKIMAANGGGCEKVLAAFAKAGINVKSWNELLAVIASKSAALKQAT